MNVAHDLARYYHFSPQDLERSATYGWWLAPACRGRRGGCKHFEHGVDFGARPLRHLIRYVPESQRAV